ncbi:hypothetical protein [Arthrobacter sp. D2-10]
MEPAIQVQESAAQSLEDIQRYALFRDCEWVVVPNGDEYAYALIINTRWSASARLRLLIMRESGQARSPLLLRVKTQVKRMALKAVDGKCNVGVSLLKSSFWEGQERFSVVKDPVHINVHQHDRETLRRRYRMTDAYWFAVVGAVTERKNLPLIIDSILSRSFDVPIGLIVVGKMSPSVADEVNSRRKKLSASGIELRIVDEWLRDEELDGHILAADCVVLAHSNEGSSGIMGKAAALGTRIVASGARSLRSDSREHAEGSAWCALEENDLASAMRAASIAPRPEPRNISSAEAFTDPLLPSDSLD